MYLNIIYGFAGVVGLLIILIVSFACYKIFKRYVRVTMSKVLVTKNIKKSVMESNEILDFFCNFNMLIC